MQGALARGPATILRMLVQKNAPLQALNTFHIAARARELVHLRRESELLALMARADWATTPRLVLGAGSNVVFTRHWAGRLIRVELRGRRLVGQTDTHWLVEAAAGEPWHELVLWTLRQGWGGLENLALIPGTVGAAPVQNIGAYGVELQDRFDSLDALDLQTGQRLALNAAQCAFGYRDSVFKHTSAADAALGQKALGLKDRALILRVRLALPKHWRPELDYRDFEPYRQALRGAQPTPLQVAQWVMAIRRAKLPDPAQWGNSGSFFKNPIVSAEQCRDIIERDPQVVHYALPDGRFKLAAGWLIDACGWRGKRVGHAAVFDRQALVLINLARGRHAAGGAEVMTLARAIQTSVYERFGLRLEPEPVIV